MTPAVVVNHSLHLGFLLCPPYIAGPFPPFPVHILHPMISTATCILLLCLGAYFFKEKMKVLHQALSPNVGEKELSGSHTNQS